MAQLAQSPHPTGPPPRVPIFSTAPGLTTTSQRQALVQQATNDWATEGGESEKQADRKWDKEQALERAVVAEREKQATEKQARKEHKASEKKRRAEQKARKKEQNRALKEDRQAEKDKKRSDKRKAEGNQPGTTRKKRVKKVYCTCRQSAGGKMVGCDGCGEWYHFDCLGFDAEEIIAMESNEGYLCPPCETGQHQSGKSLTDSDQPHGGPSNTSL